MNLNKALLCPNFWVYLLSDSTNLSQKRTKCCTHWQTSEQAHKQEFKSGVRINETADDIKPGTWEQIGLEKNSTHCVRSFRFTSVRALLSTFCGKLWVLVSPWKAHKINVSRNQQNNNTYHFPSIGQCGNKTLYTCHSRAPKQKDQMHTSTWNAHKCKCTLPPCERQ